MNDLHDELIEEAFLENYFRMVHLLSNAAINAPIPKKMLKSVATPHHIHLLIELLTVVSPSSKLKVLKIIESFVRNDIPE